MAGLARLSHGAWSDRKINPLAAEIVQGLARSVEADPSFAHLGTPAFEPAIRSWARTQARIELLQAYLAEHGDLDGEGEVRGAADLLTRLEGQVLKQADALGLTPASAARLARDLGSARASVDLSTAMASLDTDAEEANR